MEDQRYVEDVYVTFFGSVTTQQGGDDVHGFFSPNFLEVQSTGG